MPNDIERVGDKVLEEVEGANEPHEGRHMHLMEGRLDFITH